MLRKLFTFALAAALALSFGAGTRADVMDESMSASGNKEFSIKSGYYYQVATRGVDSMGDEIPDIEEHGFSLGFAISRLLADADLFGVRFRAAVSVEPELMFGFSDQSDNTLQHFFAPVFVHFDFPLEMIVPVEVSAGVGTGLYVYNLGDAEDADGRQNNMPVVGKLSFDYVRGSGLKMGVEGRGHYVINTPSGAIEDLWGVSGVARLSLLF